MMYLAHVPIYPITIAMLGSLLTIYVTLRGLEYQRYEHSSLSYIVDTCTHPLRAYVHHMTSQV